MDEMIVAAPKSRPKFSRESLRAGERLLKAVKAKLLQEGGTVDFAELRRRGYSEALLGCLRDR